MSQPQILQKIKNLLSPPVFPNNKRKTRQALMLHSFLLITIGMAIIYSIGNLLGGRIPLQIVGVNWFGVVVCLVFLSLLRRGHVNLVGFLSIGSAWLLLTASIAILGTIRTPSAALYFLGIVATGLIFDLPGIILSAVICSLSIGGLIIAENAGLLVKPDYSVGITQWISYTALFVMGGVLSYLGFKYIRSALAIADHELILRQQAEADLARKTTHYENLMRTSSDAIHILDRQGNLREWNAAFRQHLGYSDEELVGMNAASWDLQWDEEQLKIMIASLIEVGSRFRTRHRRKDGVSREVEINATGINLDGELLLYASARDITDNIRLEHDLKEQRDYLEQVITNMGQGLTITDADHHFVYVNPAYTRLFGYKLEDLIGKQYLDITAYVNPEDVEKSRAARLRGETSTFQSQLYRSDGTVAPVLFTGAPRWQDGKIAGTIGVITDLTEFKNIEKALIEERNLLRTLVDNLPHRIFAKDIEGRYMLNNREDALFFGFESPADLAGKSDFDLHGPEAAANFRDQDQSVIVSGKPLVIEYSLTGIDGTEHWTKLTKTPWRSVDGKVIGIVGIAVDISENKEIERLLNTNNEKLKQQYGKLTFVHSQLREQSQRDPLTHLYNRRYLDDHLLKEASSALRSKKKLGVVMIDLDHFKLINDSYGHLAGDEVLQVIARMVKTHLRTSDIVCRYGGEEILCLIPDTNSDIILTRIEQMRLKIANAVVIQSREDVRQTVSIGVAFFPDHGTDIAAVINAADEALYQAKQAGRNCIRVYSQS